MKTRVLVITAMVFLLMAPAGFCQEWHELIQKFPNSKINWTRGVIQSTGIGAPPQSSIGKPNARPMALRAAKVDAMRNLLEATKGVRVDSRTVVKDFIVLSDTILAEVNGVVRGAAMVGEPKYLSDGTIEVIMELTLYGNFSQVILPPRVVEPPSEVEPPHTLSVPDKPYVIPGQPWKPEPATMEPIPPVKTDIAIYTGLVVDARGLGARPAMAPKIMDENNVEVYGSAYVSREFAVQQGMSGYAKDLNTAKTNQRVANNPLVVKGIKTEGPGRSNIMISNADAARLRKAGEHLSFLEKCRVMIVLD